MKNKTKWLTISIIIYIIFAIAVTASGLVAPSKIGLAWTLFWYLAVALFMVYFYYKSTNYDAVVYYAKQLHLTEEDLREMVPDIKKSDDVPNPDKPNLFSPIVQVSFKVLNALLPQLEKQAKEHQIPRFD